MLGDATQRPELARGAPGCLFTRFSKLRQDGRPFVAVTDRDIIADAATDQLEYQAALDPGPRVPFGDIHVDGAKDVDPGFIAYMTGLEAGKVFSPQELADARARLLKLGVFSSVTVKEAKAQSMPKDNIQRAIDKASAQDGESYEEVRYEGYGPGGSAIIVEALTDNRNRTATAVRTAFSKNGGNLGTEGSVVHGFERLGFILYPADAGSEDKVLEAAMEAGAEDITSTEDGHEIWTAADDLHQVASDLEKALGEAETVKLAWKPNLTVEMDEKDAGTLLKLIDALDDDDDVQTVWGNYDISDEVMEKLEG